MTEAFVIPMNNTVVAEGGDATPLPDGTKVLATVLPTTKGGSAIVKRPYANQGENSVITALGVRFSIDEGQRGARRNLFADVPLARNLKSTGGGKFPDGTPAYFFFQFFRALGYDVDQPQGFALPEDSLLMGQKVELVLGIDQDNEGKDRNFVRFINKANGIPVNAAAPAATAAANVWKPGSAPAVQPTTAPAQAAPPAGWQPPQQAAQAGPPAGTWQPAAADVAHAQAQTAAAPPLPAGVLGGALANRGF